MAAPRAKGPPLRTYSHLAGARRLPSEYEIVTSRLLYYPQRGGFEIDLPLGRWYDRHQRDSRLRSADWELFVDPRQTTYAAYTALQRRQEAVVDGLFETIESSGYDRALSTEWVARFGRVWPVLRYPFHGLQMLASYVGQMAPSGRIVIAAAFQAGDEVRRIQRVAYRMVQLARTHPGVGSDSRARWHDDEAWQPLREAIERAFVAYDWGESFVALNLCIKPLLDELVLVHFAEIAREHGDSLLLPLSASLLSDSAWQRQWSEALCGVALAAHPDNKAALESWVGTWASRAQAAVDALDASFTSGRFSKQLAAFHRGYLERMGLDYP